VIFISSKLPAVDLKFLATISELIVIANAESRTENDIKNLNNQLKVFSPFDSTDSRTIVNAIDKTLAPGISPLPSRFSEHASSHHKQKYRQFSILSRIRKIFSVALGS
jgi:hypothetical protein